MLAEDSLGSIPHGRRGGHHVLYGGTFSQLIRKNRMTVCVMQPQWTDVDNPGCTIIDSIEYFCGSHLIPSPVRKLTGAVPTSRTMASMRWSLVLTQKAKTLTQAYDAR